MYLIPDILIIVLSIAAAVSLVFYAHSCKRLNESYLWAWMIIPCLQTAATYGYFWYFSMSPELRAPLGRANFFSFLFVLALIGLIGGIKNHYRWQKHRSSY